MQTVREAARSKRHAIVVVSEHVTDINALTKAINDKTPFNARATVLGYIQRGGVPSPRDRILASTMGVRAIHELKEGNSGCCVCEVKGELVTIPFDIALTQKRDQVSEKYKTFKELW